jgi:hypothetical protein
MLSTDRATYFAAEYAKLTSFDQEGNGAAAIREAGRLFEELLRDVIRDSLARVEFGVRKAIFDAEVEIGKGNRGVGQFGFGELLRIWRTTKLLAAIEQGEGRSTRALEAIRLDSVCELRNDCVHNAHSPERNEVVFVMSALRAYLEYFGAKVTEPGSPVRSISDVQTLLSERFSAVEVVEGTATFYRRLAETVAQPEMDTYDLTFLVQSPPREVKSQAQRDTAKEYFEIVKRRLLAREARLRRIVTFNNPPKAAWILFNLIGTHAEIYDDALSLAVFDATRGGGAADIMIPNVSMYYSSYDVSNGIAWIYSHQQDDQQNFIGLSGKSLIPTLRRLYLNWFNSCDRLTPPRAVEQFRRWFGNPSSPAEIRTIAEQHRAWLNMGDEAVDGAVRFWHELLGKHPAQSEPTNGKHPGKWDDPAWSRLSGRSA